MREDLLGYLLGALSDAEQRRLEAELAADAELREELEQVRRSLEPLAELDEDHDPPAGLLGRTWEAIEQGKREDGCPEKQQPVPGSVARQSPAATATGDRRSSQPGRIYNISDAVVLALVGLTAITLFLPALANSRYEARKNTCQNNLRVVGRLLIEDSLRQPDDRFAYVPPSGNRAFAGIYAPVLLERHLLPVDTAALVCPGENRSVELVRQGVPTLQEIDEASGPELERLQRIAGGSYAYCVGYVDDRGRYRAIKNLNRSHFPILTDLPSYHLEGRKSANHGGRGQNIFYEDGHVTFVTALSSFVGDDPLRNRQGYAERGCNRNDAVLLPSPQEPIIRDSETERDAPAAPSWR